MERVEVPKEIKGFLRRFNVPLFYCDDNACLKVTTYCAKYRDNDWNSVCEKVDTMVIGYGTNVQQLASRFVELVKELVDLDKEYNSKLEGFVKNEVPLHELYNIKYKYDEKYSMFRELIMQSKNTFDYVTTSPKVMSRSFIDEDYE